MTETTCRICGITFDNPPRRGRPTTVCPALACSRKGAKDRLAGTTEKPSRTITTKCQACDAEFTYEMRTQYRALCGMSWCERSRAGAKPTPGIVYVAASPYAPGILKIGRTAKRDQRLSIINTSLPGVQFVREWESPQSNFLEADLHKTLFSHHVEREWFSCSVEDVDAALKHIQASETDSP